MRGFQKSTNNEYIEQNAENGRKPGAQNNLNPRKHERVELIARAGLIAANPTQRGRVGGKDETGRGRVAERKEEHTNERNEKLAPAGREDNCDAEGREHGYGALECGQYDEPDAHEKGRLRKHVVYENAGVVDVNAVQFDHVGEKLDEQEETVGYAHGRDEQRCVRVAHSYSIHHCDAQDIAHQAENEQEEKTQVPEIP